jgi:ABC-2 type transport system permease protein
MYWSIRREIWENRSIYLAPLIVTAFVLFGCMISTIGMPRRMRAAHTPTRQQAVMLKPFAIAPAPIMFTTFLVGLFYSIDALYGERRDRSILFWKSLPVSDLTTVLSKAAVPLVVLPLIGFVLGFAAQIFLLLLSTIVLLGNGFSPVPLWAEASPVVMIYGLTAHVLWFAPIYAWLLLISAWARRATLLWAVLPLLATSAVERMAFNTSYFMSMLKYRVTGAMTEAFAGTHAKGAGFSFSQLDPLRFLSASGLWLGLIFAAVCLAAAVRLRRNREPI